MNKKVLKNFLLTFGVYFGLTFFASMVLSIVVNVFGFKDNKTVESVLMIISSIIAFVGTYIYTKDKLKLNFNFGDFKKNFWKYLAVIIPYWLMGLLLMGASNLVLVYLINGGIAPNEAANREAIEAYPIYSIIFMCVLGPICEELVFRLSLDGIFKDDKKFILFSGLVFGFMHILSGSLSLGNLLFIVPYSILGMTFAYIYVKTNKNICSSCLAHMIHNTFTIAIIMLGV